MIISIAVLAVGLAAAGHSIANITADYAPDVALKFAPDHPVALANKADVQFRRARPDEAMRLARHSIRGTALSSEGFQVLGLVESTKFDADRAAPVFEYSSRLSRREVPVQVWLFQQGLLNGDVEAALRRLDGAMRVSERSRPSLYPILGGAIAADDLVGPVRELFAENPVWLPGFIIYAAQNSASLPNLARIIVALPPDSAARSVDRQSMMLRGLVAAGEYSSARAFMQAIAPVRASDLVRDTSFAINGPYAPFDWDYSQEIDLAATPAGGDSGGLRYHAGTGRGGRVTRQLVILPAGTYALESAGTKRSPDQDGRAMWTVTCVGESPIELTQLNMPATRADASSTVRTEFTVPPTSCPAQWLDLKLRATFAPSGLEGVVNSVKINPI